MVDLISLLATQAERFPDKPALCNGPVGNTDSYTFAELWTRTQEIARYLVDIGIVAGDRIGILCESRAEWGLCFFSALHAGAVVVPLDVKMSPAELKGIIADCSPRFLFTSLASKDMANELKSASNTLEQMALVDRSTGDEDIVSIHHLAGISELPMRRPDPDDVAVIFYTSGTMGSSKGVMITFGNLNFQLDSLGDIETLSYRDRFLSILPLSHVLELSGGLLYLLSLGATIIYARTIFPHELIKLMVERKVTAMVGVPMFFQVLKSRIESEIRTKGKLAQHWFEYSKWLAQSVRSEKLRRLIFLPIQRKFGGALRLVISGGAPLDPEVEQFFILIGINLLQGYGMTETSPVIAVNVPSAQRMGSVGRPLRGVEVRIDSERTDGEGEVLTRGPHVMKGYYKREDLTDAAIDENGWLRTGDRGRLDEDGYLYITGRVKNLIVLANGLKIQPEEVEEVLLRGSSIAEICVCARNPTTGRGQRSSEICAIVTPPEALMKWANFDLDRLRLVVETEIEELAASLAPHKRPHRVLIFDGEMPKTTTRKVKRVLVQQWLESSGGEPEAARRAADS